MDDGVEAPDSGRHRSRERTAGWPPVAGGPEPERPTRARVTAGPGQVPAQRGRPAPVPPADTEDSGLRKFNIGLVPASVTPPRTWKRAAWFAVASSAGVLIGLAFAAAKLVGSSGPVERIGMPEYPANVPIVTDFGTRTVQPSASAEAPETNSQAPGRASGTPSASPSDGQEPANSTSGSASGSTSGGAGPTTATTPGTPVGTLSTSPTVTTLPNQGKPLVDASAIAGLTEMFYEEVTANTDSAMALTTEAFRSNASAVLEQRFADVSLIEVKEISVDPTRGVTVSTLRMTKKDGTASTERRELTFTLSGDPLINAERLATIG
jgi:hypothetical protein